jgi:hypothetical protein
MHPFIKDKCTNSLKNSKQIKSFKKKVKKNKSLNTYAPPAPVHKVMHQFKNSQISYVSVHASYAPVQSTLEFVKKSFAPVQTFYASVHNFQVHLASVQYSYALVQKCLDFH